MTADRCQTLALADDGGVYAWGVTTAARRGTILSARDAKKRALSILTPQYIAALALRVIHGL